MKNKPYPYYDRPMVNNIKDILDLQLKRNPDKIAFTYRDNDKIIDITFKQVVKEAYNLASYFNKHYKNKKIALIGENSYNLIVLTFGIMLSGNTLVIIDKDIDEKLLKELLNKVDCKDVYYSKDYVSSLDNIKVNKKYIDDTKEYIKEGKKYKNTYKVKDNDEALILFTSGTTGPNKAVVLTQKNIATDVHSGASTFNLTGSTVLVLPNHHAFGLVAAIYMPFYYSGRTFINSSFRHLTKDMQESKPELILVVPLFIETFYKQIYKTAKQTNKEKSLNNLIKISNTLRKVGIDLRKKLFKSILNTFGGELDFMISGGAYLDQKYIDFFDSIGITLINGYGITECAPVVAINRNHCQKKDSIGQVCLNIEVKVIDEELCVKGNNVMKEYYKDKKSTNNVLIDNYFHTGDLGYIDEDNYVYITGRKKNLIILSNGENISPETMENEINKDDQVQEVIVYEKYNKIIASIFPTEEYIGNQEYFDKVIYKYNKDKPKNKQITKVLLREEEHIKNNNKKILRNKIIEGDKLDE